MEEARGRRREGDDFAKGLKMKMAITQGMSRVMGSMERG